MHWQPLKVRCGWGRPAEECWEVSQGPLCWIWVPRGLEPEQRASCELCVGNSGGENLNAQPGNVPSKYMEQNPYRENKYCTHTRMLDCLFLCNGVTSLHQSNLCTWRFMFMHRSLQRMSEGMVTWFLICFQLFHARLLEKLSSRYQTWNDCVFACTWVSVHACPFSGHGSAGFGDVWSEILNATDFYALTTNQLFTIHTSGSHSVTLICSLSLSLSLLPSFLLLSQFLVLCLPLCVALIHRSHNRDTFKVIFGEDYHGFCLSVGWKKFWKWWCSIWLL